MKTEKRHRIYPPLRERARQLRRPLTPAEARLWARLRNRQLGRFKFRRQHPEDRFVTDFCCVECALAVEVDGDSHAEQAEYDALRTERLNQHGFRVIRFTNGDVFLRLEAIVEAILAECIARDFTLTPSPSPSEGEGSHGSA